MKFKKNPFLILLIITAILTLTSVNPYIFNNENMDSKLHEEMQTKINEELDRRQVKISSKNTISSVLNLFAPGKALWELIVGEQDALEVEKMKITVDELVNIIVTLDNRIAGLEGEIDSEQTTILLENIIANGDVTGLKANTSDPALKELLEKPLNVTLKDIQTTGSVTGVDLNVDQELELKNKLNIETQSGSVKFDPSVGTITFGKRS